MSAFELSVVADGPNLTASPTTPPSISRERYGELATRARLLSWLSMVVITAEAVVGIVAGLIAGPSPWSPSAWTRSSRAWPPDHHLAFHRQPHLQPGRREPGAAACRRPVLPAGPVRGFESVRALIGGEHPDRPTSASLAVTSAITMPLLGQAKQKIAVELGSSATAGEGRQNMLCAYLAGALLVGLLGNALVGAWWLDPFVGLAVAFVAVQEGIDSWKGESCCTSSPLEGFAVDSCGADDCCA